MAFSLERNKLQNCKHRNPTDGQFMIEELLLVSEEFNLIVFSIVIEKLRTCINFTFKNFGMSHLEVILIVTE